MNINKEKKDFAEKWIKRFLDNKANKYDLSEDHSIVEDGKNAGFQIDMGQALKEAFPGTLALRSWKALAEITDQINDPKIIGNTILTKWRYYNEDHYMADHIAEFEDRLWFIIAFERLIDLVDESEALKFSTHCLHKIQIISNSLCYDKEPDLGEEVEQHLSIVEDGRIYFSAYSYSGVNNYNIIKDRQKRCKIEQAKAAAILKYAEMFGKYRILLHRICDAPEWQMNVQDKEGKKETIYGSVSDDLILGFISEKLRELLPFDTLWVFDGYDGEKKNPFDIKRFIGKAGKVLIFELENGVIAVITDELVYYDHYWLKFTKYEQLDLKYNATEEDYEKAREMIKNPENDHRYQNALRNLTLMKLSGETQLLEEQDKILDKIK